jgi:deoxyribodipyrimidine photo-lyase
MFSTDYKQILEKINSIDPINYERTRNYLNGEVTGLSPYISRGVISTKLVLENIISRGYKFNDVECIVKELLWRDYFQLVWIHKKEMIFSDLKAPQLPIISDNLPKLIIDAKTGINVIDESIHSLYETGYVHNHCRMYTAMLTTNLAQTSWQIGAKWYYYHLLDGDLASNNCSWQWVCGAFSSKKYIANQENINKYSDTSQSGTYLDKNYAELEKLNLSDIFNERVNLEEYTSKLPEISNQNIVEKTRTTLIYNYYNLDPHWHIDANAQRILLLEPSIFNEFPVSERCIDFMLKLAENINDIKIFVGEFSELQSQLGDTKIIFKEHPLNKNYFGTEEPRDWIFPEVSGFFPSFFSYWKKTNSDIEKRFKK